MPVIAYIEPLVRSKGLYAAYRPIILCVSATRTDGAPIPPVVYCDIYFNGIYYKTIAKTQYYRLNGSLNSEWQFDIQDAAQEYLKTYLPTNGGNAVEPAAGNYLEAFTRVRSSGIDVNGFITPEGTAPVQGTSDQAPVAGTGTDSLIFWVFNSALQHNENQDLFTHLAAYKHILWSNQFSPLTHRPYTYFIGPNDSDFYPVINQVNVDPVIFLSLYVQFKNQIGSGFLGLTATLSPAPGAAALIYMPAGPKNLTALFPTIDFNQVSNYYVQLSGSSDSGPFPLASSVMYTISKTCQDSKRIYFVNYLGTIDAINFNVITETHTTTSSQWEAPTDYPLDVTKHGINRTDVSGNDTFALSSVDYGEEDQKFIKEFFDSPLAWMDENGQYIPVVISNGKTDTVKEEDRYTYETTLEVTLSHDTEGIRN